MAVTLSVGSQGDYLNLNVLLIHVISLEYFVSFLGPLYSMLFLSWPSYSSLRLMMAYFCIYCY